MVTVQPSSSSTVYVIHFKLLYQECKLRLQTISPVSKNRELRNRKNV